MLKCFLMLHELLQSGRTQLKETVKGDIKEHLSLLSLLFRMYFPGTDKGNFRVRDPFTATEWLQVTSPDLTVQEQEHLLEAFSDKR